MANFTSLNGYNVRDAQAEALLVDNASKNLLNITASSNEVKGVTFTVNSDKSITINGTAVGTAWFAMDYTIDGGLASAHQPIPKGWLRASLDKNIVAGVILGGAYFKEDGTSAVAFRLIPTAGIPYVNGEYPSDAYRMRTYLQVDDGTTINNVTVYPMIRRTDITDDTFEPYYRTQKQLDKNLSTVESNVTEISQSITILTQQLQALTARVEALENG